jgi:NTE family protein
MMMAVWCTFSSVPQASIPRYADSGIRAPGLIWQARRMTKTGLVLGGGGVTGVAWELGVLKGLRDGGVDLTGADTVIGTSAGSVVGAQVTSSVDLDDLYAEQTTPAHAEIGADFGAGTMLKLVALMMLPASGRGRRARIGRAAQKAHPGPATERLRVIGSRLRTPDGDPLAWPDRDLRITAVDANDGSFRVFDRTGDVDLLHAVAASCAVPLVWPPVEIGDRLYVDGGMRSAANADLATGCEVVVVIAPLSRSLSRHHALPQQLARTGAKRTATIVPDAAALEAIGKNVLDPSKREGAARAGAAQGARLAAELAEGWPAA